MVTLLMPIQHEHLVSAFACPSKDGLMAFGTNAPAKWKLPNRALLNAMVEKMNVLIVETGQNTNGNGPVPVSAEFGGFLAAFHEFPSPAPYPGPVEHRSPSTRGDGDWRCYVVFKGLSRLPEAVLVRSLKNFVGRNMAADAVPRQARLVVMSPLTRGAA